MLRKFHTKETFLSQRSTGSGHLRKPGKPYDTLVDDFVVGVEEPKRGGERRQVVYCIGWQWMQKAEGTGLLPSHDRG